MRNILLGVVITLLCVLLFRSCWDRNDKAVLKESSMLIQEQIKNVGKLIVTEGHFAEVYNYKDSQQIFGDFLTAEKKALVVVNAEVVIVYDLSKMEYRIDEEKKTLSITSIPDPEIKVNPDLEYYDVTQDYLNPFNADDYNRIKSNVKNSLLKKIENSTLKSNARNRLLSELSKFYIVTNSMGWKLVYREKDINNLSELNSITLKN